MLVTLSRYDLVRIIESLGNDIDAYETRLLQCHILTDYTRKNIEDELEEMVALRNRLRDDLPTY